MTCSELLLYFSGFRVSGFGLLIGRDISLVLSGPRYLLPATWVLLCLESGVHCCWLMLGYTCGDTMRYDTMLMTLVLFYSGSGGRGIDTLPQGFWGCGLRWSQSHVN